jgi:YYY domain-containing protein
MTTAKRLGGKALVLVVLSVVLFKPFLDSYQTPVTGLHPSEETTPIHQYLAHFGALLAFAGAWLAFLAWRALRTTPLHRGAATSRQQSWLAHASLVAFVLTIACVVMLIRGYHLVALLLPFLALVAYLAVRELRMRRPEAGPRLFLLSMLALGLGLSMGVDLVTLDGDIVRMNTVFKFYIHIWLAFAICASFAAWYLVFLVWWPALSLPRISLRRRSLAVAGLNALAVLLIAVLIYPLLATPPRLNDRFAELPRTLDGTAFMRNAVYDDDGRQLRLGADYEGIEWLRRNVRGTPAIVEGRTPLYRWGGRFSIHTGLPSVLGWDWHQTQQRGDLAHMIEPRMNAVTDFYTNPSVESARRFLRQYGVKYVIVGQLERVYYPATGLTKFNDGLGGTLDLVFENSELRIYEVREVPRLAALP